MTVLRKMDWTVYSVDKGAMVPRPAASPGNLLEIQIFRSHPGPTESETLGVGCSNLCFI